MKLPFAKGISELEYFQATATRCKDLGKKEPPTTKTIEPDLITQQAPSIVVSQCTAIEIHLSRDVLVETVVGVKLVSLILIFKPINSIYTS